MTLDQQFSSRIARNPLAIERLRSLGGPCVGFVFHDYAFSGILQTSLGRRRLWLKKLQKLDGRELPGKIGILLLGWFVTTLL